LLKDFDSKDFYVFNLRFSFIPAYPQNGRRRKMPQTEWNPKEERQYEHVKTSEEQREGRSEKDAKRIAAATVNKTRSKRGETKNK